MDTLFLLTGIVIGGCGGAVWGVLRTEIKYRRIIMNMQEAARRSIMSEIHGIVVSRHNPYEVHLETEDVKPTKH